MIDYSQLITRKDKVVKAQQEKLVQLADKRWLVESSGIVVNGVKIDTSPESRVKIDTLINNVKKANLELIDFKSLDGFVSLTVEELETINVEITLYVQKCFSIERMHAECIADLNSMQDLAAYDLNFGWPNQEN